MRERVAGAFDVLLALALLMVIGRGSPWPTELPAARLGGRPGQ